MKNKIEKYTKEFLEPLVKESINFSEVCRKVGIFSSGASWKYIKDKILFYNIDISHFLGQASFAGNRNSHIQKVTSKKEDILIKREDGIKTSSRVLRRCMIEAGIEYKCSGCEIKDLWKDKEIILEIHHIDGINTNNELKNLQFLCPNCHSQTNNYGAKNKKW